MRKLILLPLVVVLVLSIFAITAVPVHAQAPKVDVCHRTTGTNEYVLISINDNAWDFHEAHGDSMAGTNGLDEQCIIVPPPPITITLSCQSPSGPAPFTLLPYGTVIVNLIADPADPGYPETRANLYVAGDGNSYLNVSDSTGYRGGFLTAIGIPLDVPETIYVTTQTAGESATITAIYIQSCYAK